MPLLAHSGLIIPPSDVPGVTPGGIGRASYRGAGHPPFTPQVLLALGTISAQTVTQANLALQMVGLALNARSSPTAPLIQSVSGVTALMLGSDPRRARNYHAYYNLELRQTEADAKFIYLPFALGATSSAQMIEFFNDGFDLEWTSQFQQPGGIHIPYLALAGLSHYISGQFIRDISAAEQVIPVGFDDPDLVILSSSMTTAGGAFTLQPNARFAQGLAVSSMEEFCHTFIDIDRGFPPDSISFQSDGCVVRYYDPANPSRLTGHAQYAGGAPGGFRLRWVDGIALPQPIVINFLALKGLSARIQRLSVPSAAGAQPVPNRGNLSARACIAATINQPTSGTEYDGIRSTIGIGAEGSDQRSVSYVTVDNVPTQQLGSGYATDRLVRLIMGAPSSELPTIPADASMSTWGVNPALTWHSVSAGTGHEVVLTLLGDKLARIGGTVSGLTGAGMVLQLDPSGQQLQVDADGDFRFPVGLATGVAWTVSVAVQPQGQVVLLADASGTIVGEDDVATVVVTVGAVVPLTPTDDIADPIGWWDFQGDLLDRGTGGHGGVYSGASAANPWIIGRHSGRQAVSFNGVDDHIDLPGSAATYSFIPQTQSFTVAAWVMRDPDNDPGFIIGNTLIRSHHGFGFIAEHSGANPRKLRTRIVGDHGSSVQVEAFSPDGSLTGTGWFHVAVVFEGQGETATYYINASPVVVTYAGGTMPLATGATTIDISIGRNTTETAVRWRLNGALDDVRVYDRPLNQAGIAKLFALNPEPLPPPPTGLGGSGRRRRRRR